MNSRCIKLALTCLLAAAIPSLSGCTEKPSGVRVGQRIGVTLSSGKTVAGEVTEVNGWTVKLDSGSWINLREATSWREVPPLPPVDHSQPHGIDVKIINDLKASGQPVTVPNVNHVRAYYGLGPTTWTGYKE